MNLYCFFFFIADIYTTTIRTPSPGNRVEFFIDTQQNSKRSASPSSFIGDIMENPEQEKVDDQAKTFEIISSHFY